MTADQFMRLLVTITLIEMMVVTATVAYGLFEILGTVLLALVWAQPFRLSTMLRRSAT